MKIYTENDTEKSYLLGLFVGAIIFFFGSIIYNMLSWWLFTPIFFITAYVIIQKTHSWWLKRQK